MKFALDTNVFVDAFRDETFADALAAFLEQALPTTFLSAVVVQELAAGARTRKQVRELEFSILRPFERRGRVFAPSTRAFRESGRLLAELADPRRLGSDSHKSVTSERRLAGCVLPRTRLYPGHERRRL